MTRSLDDKLKEVVERDGRYPLNAYRFIYEALDYTIKRLKRDGHVTGRELLEGIRDLAIEEFGGLALMVFETWGVRATSDFGNLVFNLVNANLMGRSATDSPEDFADVYDFREVFRIDATPKTARRTRRS